MPLISPALLEDGARGPPRDGCPDELDPARLATRPRAITASERDRRARSNKEREEIRFA
jgi:hypothetical protein